MYLKKCKKNQTFEEVADLVVPEHARQIRGALADLHTQAHVAVDIIHSRPESCCARNNDLQNKVRIYVYEGYQNKYGSKKQHGLERARSLSVLITEIGANSNRLLIEAGYISTKARLN